MTGHILALDVSSSATGWAVLRGTGSLMAFGVKRPPAKATVFMRIDMTVFSSLQAAAAYQVDRVVMEWSEGLVSGWLKKTGRTPTRQAPLGQAQGAVRQALIAYGVPVSPVTEKEWTGGRTKARRATAIRMEFPEYARFHREGQDEGLDAADAIGLGLFWLAEERQRRVLETAPGVKAIDPVKMARVLDRRKGR